MKELSYVTPPNLGWLIGQLDEEEVAFLWRAIEAGGEDHKGQLAGQVKESYTIKDEGDQFFYGTLGPLIRAYGETFRDLGGTVPFAGPSKYSLSSFWCNFQREGEFNPSHDHSGVYSFVVWMKNPVSYKDQMELPMAKGTQRPVVSTFQFHYSDIVGRTEDYTYAQSPENQGTILFFPSSLRHSVFPFFSCDEERVSISGNVSLAPVDG